ncbi:hypothetical protein CCACVL1_30543 [Corchorus capsularis]|uniref:Uncharacterized protein n=1 Tax=Corchorus capsularis TaxID=210143 RepID=A0A1R3FX16_COCAP|nr:hypothetical protein CCACVL1_30543 [Corchorus capsularis]
MPRSEEGSYEAVWVCLKKKETIVREMNTEYGYKRSRRTDLRLFGLIRAPAKLRCGGEWWSE